MFHMNKYKFNGRLFSLDDIERSRQIQHLLKGVLLKKDIAVFKPTIFGCSVGTLPLDHQALTIVGLRNYLHFFKYSQNTENIKYRNYNTNTSVWLTMWSISRIRHKLYQQSTIMLLIDNNQFKDNISTDKYENEGTLP